MTPLVDFMIIGAQKCGTTGLARQLAEHPRIAFSRIKEPGFFNREPQWQTHIDRYHELFDPEPGKLCGEGSTMYTFLPEGAGTAERIHAYNAELKLIYIVRQPVERVVSHYAHRLGHKRVSAPPEQEVLQQPSYINRSRYGVQIRPYLELFGRQNVLLLIFEEYIADPAAALQTVADFLGIDSDGFRAADAAEPANPSAGQSRWGPLMSRLTRLRVLRRMLMPLVPARARRAAMQRIGVRLESKPQFSRELKQLIWRLVYDDVCTIEALLGRRLHAWRAGYEDR